VDLVFINIFGGITRCDEIANGIRMALEKNPQYRVVVRMEGTKKQLRIQVIQTMNFDVERVPDLLAVVEKVSEKVAV
jgi:succinyl-CoA synthetase beta subunit